MVAVFLRVYIGSVCALLAGYFRRISFCIVAVAVAVVVVHIGARVVIQYVCVCVAAVVAAGHMPSHTDGHTLHTTTTAAAAATTGEWHRSSGAHTRTFASDPRFRARTVAHRLRLLLLLPPTKTAMATGHRPNTHTHTRVTYFKLQIRTRARASVRAGV